MNEFLSVWKFIRKELANHNNSDEAQKIGNLSSKKQKNENA